MAQLTVPSAPKEFATHYEMLLGVDFQADQTQVDRKRSPDMVNMISDFGGNPVKRDGFRKVGIGYTALLMVDGVMYGLYATNANYFVSQLELDGYTFKTIGSPWQVAINIGDIKASFVYQKNIYTIASNTFICFDTEEHTFSYVGIGTGMMSTGNVGESAPPTNAPDNIPDTVISLKPDGTAGSTLDDKNLFSIYQRFNYQGDGTSTQYKIPTYKKIGTYVKAEVKDANGDWQTATATLGTSTSVTGKSLDGESWETNAIADPTVTITPPPSTPLVAGEDNVRITVCPYNYEELETGKYKGYYNETLVHLLSSPTATFQSGRMFVADKYKVYYSDVSDPFTISDLAWFAIDSEVVSFTKSNNYLAVLAKDNGRSTIYLASEATRTVDSQTGATETYFSVKESNAGIGAIAPKAVAILSDEPLFLSNTGIFGILTNWTSEKYAVNRSSRINRKLCKEPNLENAIAIAYNDYLYLAINGRMYVLDGRHKESDRAGNKPFEAYFFEGLPAIENMYVIDGKMYFVDKDYTYTWNEDLADTERYYDDAYLKEITTVLYQIGEIYNEETGEYYVEPTGEWEVSKPTPSDNECVWYKGTYDDGSEEITIDELTVGDKKLTGDPVCARWCSVYDDDDAPQRLKTLMKKGSMITLVPHYRSGCEITLAKDGDVFEYLGSFDSDLQTFEYIDFLRFTFSSNAVAFDNFTKKKIKKYKRLQIQVENNKAEPFGLTQITKTYIFGNYAKR